MPKRRREDLTFSERMRESDFPRPNLLGHAIPQVGNCINACCHHSEQADQAPPSHFRLPPKGHPVWAGLPGLEGKNRLSRKETRQVWRALKIWDAHHAIEGAVDTLERIKVAIEAEIPESWEERGGGAWFRERFSK